MFGVIILGILTLGAICSPRKGRQQPVKAAERTRPARETSSKRSSQQLNLAQLEAMEDQINAACALGMAYKHQAQDLQATIAEAKARVNKLKGWGNMEYKVNEITRQINKDEVKRARLDRQSADAYARAATIQAKIDKMLLA